MSVVDDFPPWETALPASSLSLTWGGELSIFLICARSSNDTALKARSQVARFAAGDGRPFAAIWAGFLLAEAM